MATIRTSVEAARGCGYRKPGGLYLVSGKLTQPCGKLPIPLHVCSTCGGGIKPQRAWQTIKPRLLFSGAECRLDVVFGGTNPSVRAQCATCPLGGLMPEKGGLLWIGGAFYKTPEDFMREARVQGISRRIPTIPKDLEVGKTVVYLAHRAVPLGARPCDEHRQAWSSPGKPDCKDCLNVKPAVFSAFVPTAVEYVVKGTETEDELERMEKRGLSLVKVERQQAELPLAAG